MSVPTDAPVVMETEVLVIGAGPAGLYGAYYAGFRGLRTVVLDVLPQVGGQVSAMYPEKPILDIAGFPAVKGRNLVDNLLAQANQYKPTYLLGRRAVALVHDGEGRPVVHTDRGEAIRAEAVVITGGIGTFTPRPLPAGEAYLGRGLVYFVPDPDEHTGRDVVIVGGGDSAFDWAAALAPIARSVRLVHRRDRFRAHRASIEHVRDLGIEIIVNAEVTALRGEGDVEAAEVRLRDGAVRVLQAQTVVAALGFTADLGPMEEWGLHLHARHITVDTRMATNLPRVFAAGDITDYPGKVRLISVGFGEAATAVNNAATVIDPRAVLFPGHSTEKDT
ncbi:NAD(P)/FAD-dependent oxidoreductase [Nonomuraea sp. NPDC050783]|uniref:NAD(P)/FAD-dependent oxidoreductase n=1 Tax=Nonomuraea sp. NPDC050783 TaxID=3154634 RepID=UPI0034655541